MQKNKLIGVIAVVAFLLGGYWLMHEKKPHEEHTHAEAEHKHDEHGHEYEGGEANTEIKEEVANASGIKVATAGPAEIKEIVALTGRIILNKNTMSEVRARFPGVVRSVQKNLGEQVKKGEVLATVESNESLQVYSVTSPIDGVIISRETNVGNVAGDTPLFTVADLTEVWAEFHVFQRNLPSITQGQLVKVEKLEGGITGEGKIILLQPLADAASQTVVAIVTLPNQEQRWRPGMTVKGQVSITSRQVPVAVSESAIQRVEEKPTVFVKEGDHYETRHVVTGNSDGAMIEIKEGLTAGEVYVSEGSYLIKADIGKNEAGHDH